MNLNSKKYPSLTYEPGKEIFRLAQEGGLPFMFDVSEELTGSEQNIRTLVSMLDQTDALLRQAREFLKKTLADRTSRYYTTVYSFMNFHRSELPLATVEQLFPLNDLSSLTPEKMTEYLQISRFGSHMDDRLNRQIFVLDLSFGPQFTDELLVVYFNADKQIVAISHES